jgi:hypothetical protein
MDLKPVDPWPPHDSPQRVTYADRWPLPEAAYNAARARFTPEAIEKIRAALEPTEGFPLEERLRRAVYDFHHLGADLLAHLGTKRKKSALAKIREPVQGLLSLLESKPQYFAEIYRNDGDFKTTHDLAAIIKNLKQRIDQAEAEIPKKKGRGYNHPRNVFFAHLLSIFEDATGREAKQSDLHYEPNREFNFFKVAHNSLIEETSDATINRFLTCTERDPARRRSRVFSRLSLLRKQ